MPMRGRNVWGSIWLVTWSSTSLPAVPGRSAGPPFVYPHRSTSPSRRGMRLGGRTAQQHPSSGGLLACAEASESLGSEGSYEGGIPPVHRILKGGAAPKVADLQTHTPRAPPSETLATLSRACRRLGVDSFDRYGDFESDAAGRSYLRRFEEEVAHHLGKEDAVFCLSGGVAQSIALLIGAKGRRRPGSVSGQGLSSFACHPTSHLLLHENDAYSELLGMEAVVIGPYHNGRAGSGQELYDPRLLKRNGCYGMGPMRASHVRDLFSSLENDKSKSSEDTSFFTYPSRKQASTVSTLILELPHREIGGKLTPWEEVGEISRLCRERGIGFHCDGARIFEASAGYGHKSVKETAEPFSSVYISFYKGLGGISGAMLLGKSELISEARVWLRRMGGNLYSMLPYAVSSWEGFRRYCLVKGEEGAPTDFEDDPRGHNRSRNLVYNGGVFNVRREKLARVLGLLAGDDTITSIVRFDPSIVETNMVHGYLSLSYNECRRALDRVEKKVGIRVLTRFRRCLNPVCDVRESQTFGCRFEWTMGEANSSIEDELFVLGWREFAKAVGSASGF